MHQKQNPAGFYTKGEEIFNAVSHGAGSVLAIVRQPVPLSV